MNDLLNMEALIARRLHRRGIHAEQVTSYWQLLGMTMTEVLAEVGPNRAEELEPLIREACGKMFRAMLAARLDAVETGRIAA